jgi:quinol monooxygenase YgiN
MLIVTGLVHVETFDLDQFRADIHALAHTSRQRDGNLFYGVALDDPRAGRLLVVERWRDQASLAAHLNAPDTLEFMERWRTRMRGDIHKYDATNERALMDE